MLSYSVLVPVYNEEDTIGGLLDDVLSADDPDGFEREEVVIVASGCSDDTIEIIQEYEGRVTRVEEESRKGKASAIREGLRRISSDVVVLSSGDIRWEEGALGALLAPLEIEDVGIVTSRPVPGNGASGLLEFYNRCVWDIHHYLSKRQPKAGELIAFRNEIEGIPETCVADEEYIAHRIEKSYDKVYAEDAVVRNSPPESLGALYRQRRRVFLGHLDLLSTEGYRAPSVRNGLVIQSLAEYVREEGVNWRIPLVASLEIVGRLDAAVRYFLIGEKPYIWEQVG